MLSVLDDDMKRVVREQRLGYVASVCPDGTPNLSPKGTTAVWDDDHLVFLDIFSPGTVANIEAGNPVVEVTDTGEGFEHGEAEPDESDELSEGGLGIAIIQALADELEIGRRNGGGSRLRFVKRLA